ncbi:MAG: PstS family phosphate ABC transporter substrate-binding protein [Planctomycetota bacterium]
MIAISVLAGCDSSGTGMKGKHGSATKSAGSGTAGVSNIEGTIKINGSSTVLPISNAVREEFNKQFPSVIVEVDGAGTGNGFEQFQNKETDISDASRPIKPGEFVKCKEQGVNFVEIPIAYDGLTIVINPENDWVQTLTIEQLKTMFLGDEAAKKWSDVDESWPEEAIEIYSPGTGSGTYDYFREVVQGKGEVKIRTDMILNEDDNVLVQGVAGNKYAIGFFGVAYYNENKDKLKAVEVVNPSDETAYLPTMDNIASGKYAPFSRPLFIYVSTESFGRAEVSSFVNFYLDNVSELCERVGYVRLPEEMMVQGTENLENEMVGTHFVDADGEKREGSFKENFKPENLVK